MLGFELQQAFAGFSSVALGFELHQLLGQLYVLVLPLRDFGARRFHLSLQSARPLPHFENERFDALKQCGSRAVAFFESGDASGPLRCGFSGSVALAAQCSETILPGGKLQFELRPRLLDCGELRLPRCDQAFLLLPFRCQPLQFALADGDPFAHPRHLAVQLLEQMSGGHRLLLGFALFFFQAIEQGSVLLDFAPQGKREHFFFAQSPLQLFEQAQHVAQLALHRERPLAALLAARHGHVVETFPGLGEKKSVRTGERKLTRYSRVRHDVAIAQLRQNHFERFAESVQDAN